MDNNSGRNCACALRLGGKALAKLLQALGWRKGYAQSKASKAIVGVKRIADDDEKFAMNTLDDLLRTPKQII